MRHVFSSEDYLALLKFRKEARRHILRSRERKTQYLGQIVEDIDGPEGVLEEQSLSKMVNKWRMDRLVNQTEQAKENGGQIGENQKKLFGINREETVR